MKRSRSEPDDAGHGDAKKAKKRDYCDVGKVAAEWPAPSAAIEAARQFLQEWYVFRNSKFQDLH